MSCRCETLKKKHPKVRHEVLRHAIIRVIQQNFHFFRFPSAGLVRTTAPPNHTHIKPTVGDGNKTIWFTNVIHTIKSTLRMLGDYTTRVRNRTYLKEEERKRLDIVLGSESYRC